MVYHTYAGKQSPVNNSEHGSLSSNLIGQNGYLGSMRLLRDSGSQF